VLPQNLSQSLGVARTSTHAPHLDRTVDTALVDVTRSNHGSRFERAHGFAIPMVLGIAMLIRWSQILRLDTST
jgi:hypothetical protein